MNAPDPDYVQWLVGESMLGCARERAKKYGGTYRLWQRPYAEAKARSASAIASVWFTAYPAAFMTVNGEPVLQTLANAKLWQAFSTIGIQGLHTGPLKRAGGLTGRDYTLTTDGNFDRVSMEIDPKYGTRDDFLAMARAAAAHNVIIIDDIIPAHTGKGADFRLAEMAYEDYPGLFHMIQIPEADWEILPAVLDGEESVNLTAPIVDLLAEKGYIVGQLQRVIFFEPGVKETDWSVTAAIVGVDGVARRWVYLHYFKESQPALNWLDPSFGAQQMIIGDALHSLDVLGAGGLRLDANGFLGVERRPIGPAWSEGHPLAVVGNQLIGGMIRKAGGFSFQELNLTVDDIALMSRGGADLSYDFITRPAYQHALVTGDTEFLRLMLRTVHEFGIDPASLIHALQNHDELTLELVHFWTLHANDIYTFQGQTWQGRTLRTHLRETMYQALSGPAAPYNLRFVTNGIACTTASLITAALGIDDINALSEEQIAQVQKIHILLAMYNAFQPGVFALSGWDLVGALPLSAIEVEHLIRDGDTRWIQRGAYDILDFNPGAAASVEGLPKAKALYGDVAGQLERPDSFASQLKRLLAVRQAYAIAASRQILIPDVVAPGLLVMVHELPDERGIQITALNFGSVSVEETVTLPDVTDSLVVDMVEELVIGDIDADGKFRIVLAPYEGKSLRIVGNLPGMA